MIKEYHENNENYELLSVDVTVSKNFNTRRFPLGSHQLAYYIESSYPVDKVVFVGDFDNSTINADMEIPGYYLSDSKHTITGYLYENTKADPEVDEPVATSEFATALRMNRNGFGLFFKCFIAMYGTALWILITLYINTYHNIDPLVMIPGALFGTVSNIMVGASLIPDSLDFGLLELVNIWGVFGILMAALSIINVNRIRTKYADDEFARFFGRVMLVIVTILIVGGNLLLPLVAYNNAM